MKKVAFFFLLTSFIAHSQTIHVIFVADEEDIKFGVTSLADEEQILRMFTNVQEHLNYKLETIYLNHVNFTATQVRTTLKRLRPQRRDIVVFYYTGRGFYPENSRSSFPHLQLKDVKSNPLSLDEVAKIIDSKHEALGLVIADCRDTISPFPVLSSSFGITEDMEWVDKLITQKLFLSNCGVIKIASSQKGQFTFTNRSNTASAYTSGLISTYSNMMLTTSIDMIDRVSLTRLLDNSINLRNVEGQDVNMEILPCNPFRRRLVTKRFPKYAKVMPSTGVAKKLRQLIKVEDVVLRKKIIGELRDNFTETANITLKQTATRNGDDLRPVKTVKAADYWKLLANHDPTVKNRVIFSSSIKRTDDFTKITAMEVQERLK